MIFRRALATLLALLAAGPVLAADLRADVATILRRLADDPDSTMNFVTVSSPSLRQEGDDILVGLEGLAFVPKSNPGGGLFIGDVSLRFHRRTDGGIAAIVTVPQRMTFKGISSPMRSQLNLADAKLSIGWDKTLAESDAFDFSASSVTGYDDDKPVVVLDKLAVSQHRLAANGHDGSFAFSLDGIEDVRSSAPVSLKGVGPLALEGHYRDFPRERQRLLARQLMLWEKARASRGDTTPPNFSLAIQGLVLLREAQAGYVIDKFLLKTAAWSLQAEADLHFSMEAARGLYGTLTAWLVQPKSSLPDLTNPAMTAGGQLAQQYGQPGKAPDGSDARVFRIELAPDGMARLNGEPAPVLAGAIANGMKAATLALNGVQGVAAKPAASAIRGATGCGVPVYPADSLKANETGLSTLTFDYDDKGALKMTRVKSSGFSRLDEAARLAYISCKFPPGTISAVIPVIWRIENGHGVSTIGPGLTTTTR
jgi:hypothetical protein